MLFHYQIGFPKTFLAPKGLFKLKYSEHALVAAKTDKYGDFGKHLPDLLDTEAAQLVEIEMDHRNRILGYVYRVSYDENRDLVLAIRPVSFGWFVKTVWLNNKCDGHSTLDKRKYCHAKETPAKTRRAS